MRSNCNSSSSGCWELSVPEVACSDPVVFDLSCNSASTSTYHISHLTCNWQYIWFKTYPRVWVGVGGKEPYWLYGRYCTAQQTNTTVNDCPAWIIPMARLLVSMGNLGIIREEGSSSSTPLQLAIVSQTTCILKCEKCHHLLFMFARASQ